MLFQNLRTKTPPWKNRGNEFDVEEARPTLIGWILKKAVERHLRVGWVARNPAC